MSKKTIILIIIILVVLGIGGYALWPEEVIHEEKPEEKFLTYEYDGATIQYPKDWVLEEELYSTPAQQVAGEDPSVVGFWLKPKEQKASGDEIGVGGRQIDCSFFGDEYKCSTLEHSVAPIYTSSTNPEVLEVYEYLLNLNERIQNIRQPTEEEIKYYQEYVNQGVQPWRKDPLQIAKVVAPGYGFNHNDEFVLGLQAASAGIAEVEATHNNQKYLIKLMRTGDIWFINSIEKE